MAIGKSKLASELVGLGTGGGGLEKLTIRGPFPKIEALFNPAELDISREVVYEQKEVASRLYTGHVYAVQKMTSIEPATLDVDLFFDTYESRSDTGILKAASQLVTPLNPFQTGDSSPVTKLTDRVVELTLPDRDKHEPPVCKLTWGRFEIFEGVLANLRERFTMFLDDGTPVRATLSCTFREYRTAEHIRAREMYSADVAKTRVVKRNDTLQSIAAEQYDDPSQWRMIAKANGIVNPRDLRPGTVLLIPKLRR